MIRGFYTAVSGIVAAMTRTDTVADAIANVDTVGYKQANTAQSEFGLMLSSSTGGEIGHLGTATYAVEQPLDTSQGVIEPTGVATDLAIEGDGLFAVQLGNGFALTRAGNFTFDSTGRLVTQQGQAVLDTNARPITVTGTLVVGSDGTIQGTNQRLAIVAWPAGGVQRLGDNLYAPVGPLVLGTGVQVHQGALEQSNVDLTESMTELVTLEREFGFSSRALSLQDETIADASQLGRLR